MNNLTIKTKVIALTILCILVISFLIVGFFLNSILLTNEENTKSYYNELLESRKYEIKGQIDIAFKAIESFYNESKIENVSKSVRVTSLDFKETLTRFYNENKDKLSDENLRDELKRFIKSYRYDSGIGYYWINDFDYKMLMHPIKPIFDGKVFIDTPMIPFVELGVDALKKSGNNSEIISYQFLNPITKEYEFKISNVFIFEPFNWIIGTGAYKSHLEYKLKEKAKKVIGNLSYGEDGYFWINDIDGNMISHPKKHLEGKNFLYDEKVSFVQLGIDIAKVKVEGFTNYKFPKAGSNKYEPKLSYIKYFPQWKWMIGTGVYVDDIIRLAQVQENKNNEKIEKLIITLLLIISLSILIIVSISIMFTNILLIRPLKDFQDGLLGFFKYLNKNSDEITALKITTNDEIGKMSKLINRNIITTKNLLDEEKKLLLEKEILKDKQLLKQSRLAQMGEMISMIAYQWRQPLSAISTTAINLEMKIEFNSFDTDTKEGRENQNRFFLEELNNIGTYVQNLTHTIDDFRNFYKPNKKAIITRLEDVVEKSLDIIKISILNDNIELVQNYQCECKLKIYDSEVTQVILNILKNAQDNFKEKNIKNPKIIITVKDKTIKIEDNGGGIQEKIVDNIFTPYFSTKDEKNGTGLGLYMSKTIIEDHHGGILSANNIKGGVCFTIDLSKREIKK